MTDGLEALSDVIGGALPESAGRAADVAAIARRWPEAVGEAIAREAWPARLTPDGELVVHASGAVWASELSISPASCRAVSRPSGSRRRPGSASRSARSRGGAIRMRHRRRKTAPPNDPRAERWTESIRDPELREAVSAAARSWLRRSAAESGPDRANC